MPDEYLVFMHEEDIPSPIEWLSAIRQAGFDMEMDTDFVMKCHEGFLPCRYNGHEAGFEFCMDRLAESGIPENELAEIGARKTGVVLVANSGCWSRIASIVAGSVLCSMVNGLLVENGEPPFIDHGEALDWARRKAMSVEMAWDGRKMYLRDAG